MFFSKNIFNLSLFIPLFSYKVQPKTPLCPIANIAVYFLNTSCDCVVITHLLPTSL